MNQLKNELQNKISLPAIEENTLTYSTGIVVETNSSQNVCTVNFVNGYNGLQQVEKIPVRNDRNDDWFPQVGEPVRVRSNDTGAYVVGTALDDNILKALRSVNHENFSCKGTAKQYGRYIM